jgi:hypothetical protein
MTSKSMAGYHMGTCRSLCQVSTVERLHRRVCQRQTVHYQDICTAGIESQRALHRFGNIEHLSQTKETNRHTRYAARHAQDIRYLVTTR